MIKKIDVVHLLRKRILNPLFSCISFLKGHLVVYYYLDYCPASFDFLFFLTRAELQRKRKNCKSIKVLIYPKRKNLKLKNPVDPKWELNRVNNIIIPIIQLFPSVTSYALLNKPWEFFLHSGIFNFSFPHNPLCVPRHTFNKECYIEVQNLKNHDEWGMKVPDYSLNQIRRWKEKFVKNKKLIVITLRYSQNVPERNSNIEEWAKFAASCNQEKYFIVFVMDTDTILDGYPLLLKSFTFFDAATWNISMRAALYQEAYIHLSTSIGPAALSLLNEKTRYILFKIVVDNEETSSLELLKELGFEYNQNVSWSRPFQQLIWENDKYEVIKQAFDKMCASIETQEIALH